METKTEKKKGKAGFLVLILFLLILIAATLILNRTDAGFFIRCHLSKAPRMNCEVVLNADGEPVSLTEDCVTALKLDNGEENTISDFEPDVSGCSFKCKGGEYGNQPFQITFTCGDGKTAVIPVRPVIASSWAMSDVTLAVSADSETETCAYRINLRVNGKAYTQSGEVPFDDETGITVSSV